MKLIYNIIPFILTWQMRSPVFLQARIADTFLLHDAAFDKNINKLIDIPIWAFHGKIDDVVPFEETERMAKKLEGKNKDLRFTVEPDIGHWAHWLVYSGQELYDWFLKYDKRLNK